VIDQKLNEDKDKIIELYLKKHPDEEDQHEDVIFERAKVILKTKLKEDRDKADAEFKVHVDKVRDDLIGKVPKEYKEFIPEIKKQLQDEDDDVVIHPDFDVMNLAYWARGKKFTPEYVKSLEDAAFKRGSEDPKIKAQKAGISTSEARSTPGKPAPVVLSDDEKERALEIFASKDDWSDERKFKEYKDNYQQHDQW
jgi:hypothetical protein